MRGGIRRRREVNGMQAIIVNGTLEEIAALVLAAQGQQAGKLSDCVRNILNDISHQTESIRIF